MIERPPTANYPDDFFLPDASENRQTALAATLWHEFSELFGSKKEQSEMPDFLTMTDISADPPEDTDEVCDPMPALEGALLGGLLTENKNSTGGKLLSARPLEILLTSRRFDQCNRHQQLQRETLRAAQPGPAIQYHHMAQAGKTDAANQIVFKQHQGDLRQESAVDRIARAVSRHEGQADSINWNDNGAGISVGMFQANQKRGQLPSLLQAMEKADSSLFAHIFGQEFAELVKTDPEKIRRIEFTKGDDKPNSLGLKLEEALRQPLFEEVQGKMLREKILHAAYVASEYGLQSERGVALVADLINQLGEGQRGGSSGARRYLKFALSQGTEAGKLAAIVKHDFQGCGRAYRDKDIMLDPSLDALRQPSIASSSFAFNLSQTLKTKSVAVHPEADYHTRGYI